MSSAAFAPEDFTACRSRGYGEVFSVFESHRDRDGGGAAALDSDERRQLSAAEETVAASEGGGAPESDRGSA